MATTLVTQSMLLDLEALAHAHSAFADRLNALLDALSVPPQGQGRSKWLVNAAGIQPVAAGKWFTGTKPRRSNLTTLTAYITAHYPVNATQEELLDFLTGKYIALDVNAELARSGLTPPEQGFVQTVVARAMKEKGLDPLAPDGVTARQRLYSMPAREQHFISSTAMEMRWRKPPGWLRQKARKFMPKPETSPTEQPWNACSATAPPVLDALMFCITMSAARLPAASRKWTRQPGIGRSITI